MTYTLQELALQYAERLVEFHDLDQHVREAGAGALRRDVAELRMAREAMYAAQEALNDAAQRHAEMNYA
jgi:hypothetical protein